jgi:hypothetical protein
MKRVCLLLIAAALMAGGSGLLMAQTNKPTSKNDVRSTQPEPPRVGAYAVAGDKIITRSKNSNKTKGRDR